MYPRPLPLYPPTTTKKWKESRMCGSGAKCGGGGGWVGRKDTYTVTILNLISNPDLWILCFLTMVDNDSSYSRDR